MPVEIVVESMNLCSCVSSTSDFRYQLHSALRDSSYERTSNF